MNGDRIVADSSALIHLLDGHPGVTSILQDCETFVSFISEIEVLSGKRTTNEVLARTSTLLSACTIIDVNPRIKELVIILRRKYGLKVPDLLVAATAIYMDVPLLTSDKDFKRLKEEVAIYWI